MKLPLFTIRFFASGTTTVPPVTWVDRAPIIVGASAAGGLGRWRAT